MSVQSEIVEPEFGCSACVLAAAGAPETGPESHAPMCPQRWEPTPETWTEAEVAAIRATLRKDPS